MNGLTLSLLSAGMLAGLVTIGLPTLIHLLSRRRARVVRFAPMELLLRSQKRTARSIRLRNFLLLAVRTLLVAAVAAALLQPLLDEAQGLQKTSAPVAVIIAIDSSASMHTTLDGRTLFRSALKKAEAAIADVPPDVRVGVVACGAEPRDLLSPTFDQNAARSALDALERQGPEQRYADLGACLGRAATLALTVNANDAGASGATGNDVDDAAPHERRVILISDLAAHGFPRQGTGATVDVDARGLRVELRQVGDSEPPPNHGLRDVDALATSQGLQVHFEAAWFPGVKTITDADHEVTADLFVGRARGPRSVLPMRSGAVVERTFTAGNALLEKALAGGDTAAAETGGSTLTVVLEDDALTLDNQVVLPTERRPGVRVLIVDGEPDALPFSDEVYYLHQALQASRVGAEGQSRLQVTTLPPEKVDAASLADVDVVVLANVARLSAPAAAAVVSHAEAGHGVFITAGDQMDTEFYNGQLAAILPAVLRGTKRQALLDDAAVDDVLGLARFKAEHPILRAFAGSTKDALPGLSRVRTTASMLVEPDPNAARDVLARFTNDAPALLERAVGPGKRGRVLLLTTSIDREWTDLPIRPGYLPLMEQIVLYLAGALEDERPRTIRVGQPRALRVPADVDRALVVLPDGRTREVRREATPSPDGDVDDDGSADDLLFTETELVGLYQVRALGNDGTERSLPGERFSALLDPRESDLSRVDDDTVAALLPKGAAVQRDRTRAHGTPLWPWLLLGAVALWLAEAALVARRRAQ